MSWPWTSQTETSRRAADRKARFVQIARDAHDRARRDLGPQALKPRDWERAAPRPANEARRRRAGPT